MRISILFSIFFANTSFVTCLIVHSLQNNLLEGVIGARGTIVGNHVLDLHRSKSCFSYHTRIISKYSLYSRQPKNYKITLGDRLHSIGRTMVSRDVRSVPESSSNDDQSKNSFIGAASLIAGTTIGGGFLGLPHFTRHMVRAVLTVFPSFVRIVAIQ